MKLLIDSLAMLPLGGELQQTVMKAVQDISKHAGESGGGGGDPQAMIQMLSMLGRQQKAEPMPQAGALNQMMGGGGGGAPPPPGGAPPPPGGPPPGM